MLNPSAGRSRSWLLILLIVPFIFLLYPPFYTYTDPSFFGVPFFYWFQLAWIIITALITAILYWLKA